MYAYAGNNPIKYVDPDGRADVIFPYEKFLNCVMDDNRQISDNISYFTKGFQNTLEYCNEMADVCDTVNYCTAGMCFPLISYLKVNYLKNGSNYLAQDGFSYLVTAEKELKRLNFLIKEYGKNKDVSSAIFTEFLTKQKELLQQEYIQKSEELNKKHGNNINSEIQEKGKIYSDTKINYLKQYKKYAPEKRYKDFCEKIGLQYEE